ncbi:hypothetical protein BpHYR1_001796 [Brachionus plicatilis]|uniref:Uncharacterized protein n=1 Tax=Brachionus plicatilis TaxID=10195 RepID=A0A3M7RLK7_BRAPC|nr:hypothetical protein BpHYR1_001796 [Brachionus plicatilis]
MVLDTPRTNAMSYEFENKLGKVNFKYKNSSTRSINFLMVCFSENCRIFAKLRIRFSDYTLAVWNGS